MLLNYSVLSTTNIQDNPIPYFLPSKISLLYATYDSMYIGNILSESDMFTNTGEKQERRKSTIMSAEFDNNLEAGDFSAIGHNVTSVRFKKKKKDEFKWVTFAEVPYDNTLALNNFVLYDRLAENQVEYDYAICAVCAEEGNTEGTLKSIGTIKSEFDNCYIFGESEDNYYKLSYNLTQGNIEWVIPNTVVNMLGGTSYPVIIYNGNTKYRRGSIQCYLFSNIDGGIDISQERILRNQIMNFLCDKKPKVIKSEEGTYMLVNIIDTPQLIPNNKSIGVYQLSFKFVECGDIYDRTTLENCGFIKGFAVE